MAYYTGSANDYPALLTALVNACVAEGWTWADSILSKGAAFVRPYVSTTFTTTQGPGLIIQGGTGKSAGALVGGSVCQPRIGRVGASANSPDLTFPVDYYLHIFSAPDEVFLVVRTGVDRYYFLSFGVSDVPGLTGTGLWLAGAIRRGYSTDTNTNVNGWAINPTGIYNPNSNNNSVGVATGFMWRNLRGSDDVNSEAIHGGFDGVGWNGAGTGTPTVQGALNAISAAVPLIGRSPSAWNGESILLPIQGHVFRASSKCSLALEVKNARYLRIDNHDPLQLITLGADKWRVYPFHRKNSAVRDGSTTSMQDHTGTFGWAIRYDGP